MMIHVKVKPNSLKDEIVKIADDEYKVNIREPAEDGRANVKLINMLAKEFKVDFTKIKIKNPKSRKKIVEINI